MPDLDALYAALAAIEQACDAELWDDVDQRVLDYDAMVRSQATELEMTALRALLQRQSELMERLAKQRNDTASQLQQMAQQQRSARSYSS